MTRSPVKVAPAALKVGKQALPLYSHAKSPQRFTLPQLFACLVLKMFFRTDYRGIEQLLKDLPNLQGELGLSAVPYFTTLQECEQRLLRSQRLAKLLESSLFFGEE